MKACVRAIACVAFALAAGRAAAADVGRVVLAAGETTALRQGQVVRLNFGSPVQDQDTLRTGTGSNLQVRFEDDSYVSLREGSELRVQEFRFSGKEDGTERALFNLLKGGFRAITGLVGRQNHRNYQVVTPTATIGIRGTDYATTLCQGDCRNADGSPAKDGLYGRVIGQSNGTNQIDVTNDADSKVFGINSNFFTSGRNSPIEPLLVVPDFVLSKLEGRSRGGSKGSAGGTGSEQATAGGATEESRPSTTPEPLPQLQFVATNSLGPQGTPVPIQSATTLPPPNGFVVVYPLPLTAPFGDVVFDDGSPFTYNSLNQLLAFGTPGVFPAASLGGGSITDPGSMTLNGQLFTWGRWTGNTTVALFEGGTFTGAPVLFGTAAGLNTNNDSIISALGGVATYTYVGGPKPVDAGGNIGSITTSSATINFTTQSSQLSVGMSFPSILVSGSNTGSAAFNLSGPGFRTGGPFIGEFIGSLSGTCTGGGCLGGSGSAFGFYAVGLAGPNGYDTAVIGGVAGETNAGDVAFLNLYNASSFTAGPPPTPPTMGQVAFANASPTTANTATISTPLLVLSGSNLVSFGDGVNFPSGSLNGGSVIETGSTTLVDGGTMNWGRWTGTGVLVVTPTSGTLNPSTGMPYVIGSGDPVLPTSGSFVYSYAGGPNPVNVQGAIGTFTGGAFNVAFGASSGSMSVASPLTMTVGGVSYSLNSCSSGCTFTPLSPVAGNMALTGSCIGGPCSTFGAATANAAGVFVGPQGAGLAVAGNVFSPAPTVTFGAAFKR